jgi:hypothetical protein
MTITFERVHPGGLIRANEWNAMAAALEGFDARLIALEADGSGGSTTDLAITDVEPDSPHEREVMEIIGQNFGVPASLNTVTLDGGQPLAILPGSDDELLRVTVPAGIPGLPKPMLLEVETTAGGVASRFVTIQAEAEIPGGQPTVTDATTGVGTIAVGGTYPFTFVIDANAVTMTEQYAIEPLFQNLQGTATEQNWKDASHLVGTDTQGRVTIVPATPITVGVTITIPNGAVGADLRLRARSINNEAGSSRTSAPVPIIVGVDQPESDPRISLLPGQLSGTTLRAVEDPVTHATVIQVKYPTTTAFRQVNIPIAARFLVAGTYAFTAVIDNPGTTWTLMQVAPAASPPLSANGALDVAVQVRLNISAPAGERRNLTVTATRQGATAPGQISAVLVLPIEGATW